MTALPTERTDALADCDLCLIAIASGKEHICDYCHMVTCQECGRPEEFTGWICDYCQEIEDES